MNIKHTYHPKKISLIPSGCLCMCMMLLLSLTFFNGFTQSVSKRPYTSSATSDVSVMTIAKPEGTMPGDVLFVQITQHSTTQPTSPSTAVNADGWIPVTETQTIVGGPTNQPAYWKKSVLYHIVTVNDPASFVFYMDASFNFFTGSMVAFYNVDFENGISANGVSSGPFDVLPVNCSIGSGAFEMYSNQITTATSGAGMVMFSTYCGVSQFNQLVLMGNAGNDLPMEMVGANSISWGQGISDIIGFAVEEMPGLHQYGVSSFEQAPLSATISFLIALKPMNNSQVNTQVIYPTSAVCANSNELLTPQIIGRNGGHFSSSTSLNIDSLTGSINPALSVAGDYTIRYFIAPQGSDQGVDVTVFVSIIAPPVVQVVANRNNICEGDTLFLTASAVSNIPNNEMIFSWTGPNGFNSGSSNTYVPSFSSVNEGIYTATVRGTALEGCATTQATPFIYAASAPTQASITGDASVCAGGTAHLYVNITGGNAPYQVIYNSGRGSVNDTILNYDGAAIARILSTTTSYYLLGVKSAAGCSVQSLSTTPATINVIPVLTASLVLSGSNPICRGTATGLKVNITGATGGTYKIVYSDGTQEFTLNNYTNGAVISVTPVISATYNLLSVQLNGSANNCSNIIQNSAVTITVNEPVSFSDLYVSTSNPICGGANYRANLKINLIGGKVPFSVVLSRTPGTDTTCFYDTTSATVSRRYISVRPVVNTLYKISSITDGNGCRALPTGVGDTVTVKVVPTATSNSGIYVKNLADYRSICAGNNARTYLVIYKYTGSTIGTQQDYTNRYTVILALKLNGVLMRYDTVRNYLNRAEIVSPTNILWSGSLEIAPVKIINSLNCATSNFSTSSAQSVFITLKPAAIPGNITGSTEVCSGVNTANIELRNYSGSIQWYSASAYAGPFLPISGATANVYVAQNLNASTYFKALVTNNTCSNYSAVASIVVSRMPIAGSLLGTDTTCMGEDASVMLSNAVGNVVWQISYDGAQFSAMPNDTGLVLDIPSIQNNAYYQAMVTSGVCPAVQSAIHQVVVKDPGMWVGASGDERWENPNNWACGRVPDTSTNVTIRIGGSGILPMIGADSYGVPDTANVHNIYIDTDAQLNIYEGGVLRISGNLSGNGIIDSRDGNIEMVGIIDTQRIQPNRFTNNTLKTLKIGNTGGILSIDSDTDTLRVTDKVIFGTHHATLYTNDRLVLVSNENSTASIADMTSDGIHTGVFEGNRIVGKVTVERYIPEHYKAWQFLAAPAKGQTIKDAWQEGNETLGNARAGYGTIITSNVANAVANGFDTQTPGSSFKMYNAQTNTWVNVPSTTQPIENTSAYMLFVRGDRSVTTSTQVATPTTLRVTGNLYTPLDNPPTPIQVMADQYEAVGNPYASAIDFSKITKTGGIQDAFYVWDPRLTNTPTGAYGFGAYQTFVGVGDGYYRVIPGGGSYGDPGTLQRGNIQSGQAFFVRSAATPATMVFQESCKVGGSAIVTRLSSTQVPRLSFNLSHLPNAATSVLVDGAFLEIDTGFSSNVDGMDIRKIFNSSENISIVCQGNALVTDRRSLMNREDTVWLSLGQLRVRNYRLEILPEFLDLLGREARLYDAVTQTYTTIHTSEKTIVDFSVTNAASANSNRFCIVFSSDRNTLPVKITQITAERKSADVLVHWKTEQESMIAKYVVEKSLDGKHFTAIQEISAKNISGVQAYTITDVRAGESKLFYRIKTVEATQATAYTRVVSVSECAKTSYLEIFPNPVTDHVIHLFPAGVKAGTYALAIYDMGGKKVFTGNFTYDGAKQSEISIPQSIPVGMYRLVMQSETNSVLQVSVQIR